MLIRMVRICSRIFLNGATEWHRLESEWVEDSSSISQVQVVHAVLDHLMAVICIASRQQIVPLRLRSPHSTVWVSLMDNENCTAIQESISVRAFFLR